MSHWDGGPGIKALVNLQHAKLAADEASIEAAMARMRRQILDEDGFPDSKKLKLGGQKIDGVVEAILKRDEP